MTEKTTINLRVGNTETGPVDLDTMREALDQVRGGPPMKDDPDWNGHNSQVYGVAAGELRQFIEQFEQLEAEKKDVAERQKELMAEAKARGYDTKVMRKVIALRKRDKDDIAEEEAILEMYKAALGMV
ncbi:DUF2312 domain-containing protein [Paracoccus yeei]|uniref:DUF2312 domain-containing protein n=2 Tax=Paracoccus yeei TaxID=147645 RepID=A0A386UIW8_9RHOB|nr:DUF2312 domain-containing protein [Paracoccus yeei]AZV00420.1 hypothetical protein pyei1_p03 [Paracoccus phage vB_PyeM_Pyei1]